ncbi:MULTISPECIES: hypothetical protein [Streptomyces]|nr:MULTISPECIES: hypothetical protein [unclassified Streptomyces]NMI54664.1 hypothetical protein [Streptomyces sp. RLA2-12]
MSVVADGDHAVVRAQRLVGGGRCRRLMYVNDRSGSPRKRIQQGRITTND